MSRGPLAAAVAGLDRAVQHLAKAAAWAAGGLLILMIGHVLLEIGLRALFATSTFVLDEFVGYGVAAVTFLASGYAFQEEAFIRVGLLLDATRRRPLLRRALELAAALTAAAVVWYLAWYFWLSVARHLQRGTVSETVAEVPLWIPEGLMLLGLAILGLRIGVYALKLLTGACLPLGAGGEAPAEGLRPLEHGGGA